MPKLPACELKKGLRNYLPQPRNHRVITIAMQGEQCLMFPSFMFDVEQAHIKHQTISLSWCSHLDRGYETLPTANNYMNDN